MTVQTDIFEGSQADGLPARAAAFSILSDILGRKKMMEAALEGQATYAALGPRDRAFARMLAATVLRRRGQMDDLIARAMNKGDTPRPDTLRWVLYLGIAQILFMDVADHAAVDTSVTLAAQNNMGGQKGFVNAVLRRIAGPDGRAWLAAQDAAALNIPAWLYNQWRESYGPIRAKDIAAASLAEAALDITVRDAGRIDEFAAALSASALPSGSLRRESGGHVADLPGFDDGAWWVQDASSAIPARLFGAVAGKTVLDLCAAPGGKTMQLAAMGANVVALDRSASRMAMLSENLKRVGLAGRVKTIVEDAAGYNPREAFTHILLDAPCTATGTIRRHPDLLALKTEKDQAGLMSIQSRLLDNAARLLAPGGTLIYCTCSLQKAEGEHQIDRFLADQGRVFRRAPIRREEYGNIDGPVTADGDARILPYHLKDKGGMDGFYIARLQKKA